MLKRSAQLSLALKALIELLMLVSIIGKLIDAHGLERHAAADTDVAGQVDRAHGAPAENRLDHVVIKVLRFRLRQTAHALMVTDAGRSTWKRGRGDGETRGRGDRETRGRGDAGTRGRGDAGTGRRGDAGTRGRGDGETRGRGDAGTRGRRDAITREREAESSSPCLRVSASPRLRVSVSP